MSKLEIIKEALKNNPNVVIAYTSSNQTNDFCEMDHLHPRKDIKYLVAPKDGLYTADKLQNFMMELIPDLDPGEKKDFSNLLDVLNFGKLCFYDEVGNDEDSDVIVPYIQEIRVCPFPCEEYIRDLLEDTQNKISKHSASPEVLEKYNPEERENNL